MRKMGRKKARVSSRHLRPRTPHFFSVSSQPALLLSCGCESPVGFEGGEASGRARMQLRRHICLLGTFCVRFAGP